MDIEIFQNVVNKPFNVSVDGKSVMMLPNFREAIEYTKSQLGYKQFHTTYQWKQDLGMGKSLRLRYLMPDGSDGYFYIGRNLTKAQLTQDVLGDDTIPEII